MSDKHGPPTKWQAMKRGRIKSRNNANSSKARARDYGLEAPLIRLMPCAVACSSCRGRIVCAHHPSRGANGGRFDQGPLCYDHHVEQGDIGVLSFQSKYDIDLRELWDEIALGHERPLGLRGVADRWMARESLADYELDSLVDWVRRYRWRLEEGHAGLDRIMADHGVSGGRLDIPFATNVQSQLCIGSNARPGSPCRVAFEDRVAELMELAA